jgi:hypothetical protein
MKRHDVSAGRPQVFTSPGEKSCVRRCPDGSAGARAGAEDELRRGAVRRRVRGVWKGMQVLLNVWAV